MPRKCIGKNVILTPIKRATNCISLKVELEFTPKKIGHQLVKPTMIVKTAPILKT
jgi:hypothetical protein